MPRRRRLGAATANVDDLWHEYKNEGSIAARDDLVEHFAPLARVVAQKLSTGLPPSVDVSDLESYGLIGLLDAVHKYDLDRGIKFETYAAQRIKGAIIDELRSIDWVPRSVRAKARDLAKATGKLEATLHRAPTDDELAAAMDISTSDVREIRNDSNWATLTSSAVIEPENGGGGAVVTQVVDTLADRSGEVDDFYELDELSYAMSEAMGSLVGRELEVARMYYLEGMTLAEIGHFLGVTESRVCQLHTKATEQLRKALTDEMKAL